jgi:hypothetical protein
MKRRTFITSVAAVPILPAAMRAAEVFGASAARLYGPKPVAAAEEILND